MRDKNNFNNFYTILINSFVSFFAILLSSYISYYFAKNNEYETRIYMLNKEALTKAIKNVLKYADYNTVNWKEVDDLYYRPYNCDWDDKYNKYIEQREQELTNIIKRGINITPPLCDIWHKLQNAKLDFRIKTTEIRIICSDNLLKMLQKVEEGFDDVFLEIVKDMYYERAFIDKYNEVMPLRFQQLEKAFRNELRNDH